MNKEKKKVVVVGAGMAGLTSAAYLTRENYDVLILEKNNKSGGLVGTFQRDGFSFDTGPRAFVNSGMVKPILKDLDIDWETLENTIAFTIEDQNITIDSMASLDEYKQMLFKLYPDSRLDIERIIKSIRMLSDNTKTLYEFDNPYFVDYMSDKKFLLTKFLPWAFKLLFALRKFKQYNMPMETFLKRQTGNKSLINILTQFFFKKTPTYFALGYFYVWLDYFYPKGGTGILPKLLHEKVLANGGTIQFDTKIEHVIPSESKIVDTEGKEYTYDHLVWAADLKTLYMQLVKKSLGEKTLEKIYLQSERVLKAKPAESSFIVNIAVDRPPSYFIDKGGAHHFYTPSRRGLGDEVERRKQELLENLQDKTMEDVSTWLDEFCRYNTYEVSIPVLRDSTLAPEGKTGIMISCLFDYEVMADIHNAGWTNSFKKEMENMIIKIFSEVHYKDLEKDVLFSFSTTPLTIKHVIGSSGGAIVGWSFETASPVYNELKDMPKCALTPIPNVYQAGQWAYAPAGVPIAMLTGWHASQEIIKRSKHKN